MRGRSEAPGHEGDYGRKIMAPLTLGE